MSSLRWPTILRPAVGAPSTVKARRCVESLRDRAGLESFLEFVELSLDGGFEHGLRRVYQVSLAELERDWHVHVKTSIAAVGDRTGSGKAAAKPRAG